MIKYQPFILHCPNGKYTYRGSLPAELCDLRDGPWGRKEYYPKIFDSYQEAIDFARAKGYEVK